MKMARKVIDYKMLEGKRYYKVKWECSWESEDNLLHCRDLVEQFWSFINRVKSEDDQPIDHVPVRKKVRIDDNNGNPCHIRYANDSGENNTHSYTTGENNTHSYTNIVPCIDIQRKHDEMAPKYSQRQGNGDRAVQKYSYLRGNGERIVHHYSNMQGSDDSGGENGSGGGGGGIIRKTRHVTNIPDKGVTIVDNTVSNHMSTKGIDVQPQHKQQYELYEKSKVSISGSSESCDQIHADGLETFPSGVSAPDMLPTQNPNDSALHWTNPYVQISFLCRVCHEEQPFTNHNKKWEKHFLTHVEGSHADSEEEEDSCTSSVLEEASSEDTAIIEDPERPWIQRVEYIIQKWGVSQYVRLVFSCRICNKEQQASHTGNWRNHYNSHHDNRPHACKKCSKIFKSKSLLTQHLKDIHNESDGRNVSHTCFVCGSDFNRKLDMRRHIAVVHNIDPKTISGGASDGGGGGGGENRAILNIINKTIPSSQKNNQPPMHKESVRKENTKLSTIIKVKDSELVSSSSGSSNSEMIPSQSKSDMTPRKSDTTPRKTCNSPFDDFTKTNIYKHTCGICQQRFRKKIDLKCHTIEVHCIDINQSNRSDSCDSLIPSMVGQGEIDSIRNKTSTSEYQSSDNDADVRVIVSTTNETNPENMEILLLVKEERLSSDDEERGDNILTIDEKECTND